MKINIDLNGKYGQIAYRQKLPLILSDHSTLTKMDLLAYYSGEDVKDKFRLIEKERIDL